MEIPDQEATFLLPLAHLQPPVQLVELPLLLQVQGRLEPEVQAGTYQLPEDQVTGELAEPYH
jgi:hypothetical protein